MKFAGGNDGALAAGIAVAAMTRCSHLYSIDLALWYRQMAHIVLALKKMHTLPYDMIYQGAAGPRGEIE